jgi:hypothetical protein
MASFGQRRAHPNFVAPAEFAHAWLQVCAVILPFMKVPASAHDPWAKGFTPLVYESREILVQVVLYLLFIAFATHRPNETDAIFQF